MRRLLAVWVVGVLAVMGVLGACGGSDDDSADDGVQAAADTSGDEEDAGGASDDGDKTDGDGSDDDASDANSGADLGVFSAARCAEAVQVYSAAGASAAQAMSGETKAMEASIKQMEEFADGAPRGIREDLQLMSKAYSAYVTGIAESGWNPASGKAPTEEQIEKLDAASRLFQEEDYIAAQENIDKWFGGGCSGR